MKTITPCFFALLMLVITPQTGKAQEVIPPSAQYYQHELFINPAVTGAKDYLLSSNLNIQFQWMEIEGAPRTQQFQLHSPFFNNRGGLGVTFQHQSLGVTHSYNANLAYAYHIPLSTGKLSFGLQAGVVSTQNRYADAYSPEFDPKFASNTQAMWGMNFGAGAYYSDDNFYVGLSLPAFMDNTVDKESGDRLMGELNFSKAPIYLTAGYLFKFYNNYVVKPNVLLGYSNDYKFIYNVGATVFIDYGFWVGANVYSRNQVSITIGVAFLKNFNISYVASGSYGSPYSYRGMSHEINLGFLFSNSPRSNGTLIPYF